MNEPTEARISRTLRVLFRDYDGPPFAIRLWDGTLWRSSPEADPVCTIRIENPHALRTLIVEGSQVALGEAFIHRQIDVDGDLFSVFSVAEHVLAQPLPLRIRLLRTVTRTVLTLTRSFTHGAIHSPRRDRESIAYHYDQPVDFFRPWLGPTLVYSCAYFRSSTDSLDQAQENKLELICRKLRLAPGERFLDIGCGWGSLVLHAASRHGAHAHGITLSRSQADVTRQRIQQSGLDGRASVVLQDYRQLNPVNGLFDKIASVGMCEHVGLAKLPAYFAIAARMLQPGGVFLNHGIVRAACTVPRGHDSFITRYVFPGGELVTLAQIISAAESAGFEIRDVENLREHYARTLRCWVAGLRHCETVVRRHVEETTYRIWLLYMAGCAAAFERGHLGVCQMLLSRSRNGDSHLPLTREDWYHPSSPG